MIVPFLFIVAAWSLAALGLVLTGAVSAPAAAKAALYGITGAATMWAAVATRPR